MNTKDEHEGPSEQSLQEMPELDFSKLTPGRRGRYAHLATGNMVGYVKIEPDVWEHFQSGDAINEALRAIIAASRHVRKTG